MLYKLDNGKDVFDLNPELKSVVEFERCTDKQFRYVALFTDYKSPLRRLGIEDKKYQAAILAGYKLEKDGKRLDMNGRNVIAGKVGNIEAAIKKYKELDFDEDYETLISITTLIKQIRDLNGKEEKSIAELDKAIAFSLKLAPLMETKKKLEKLIDLREDAPTEQQDTQGTVNDLDNELVDEGSLSLLDEINATI